MGWLVSSLVFFLLGCSCGIVSLFCKSEKTKTVLQDIGAGIMLMDMFCLIVIFSAVFG